MECYENVDDYCDVHAKLNLQIPETIPSSNRNLDDRFFISIEVETTVPIDEDDDEADLFVRVKDRKVFTFWAGCPRFKKGNLSRERISSMLSSAGVALHKQDFMVDAISVRADEVANEARNKASSVLPLSVFISVVACSCYQI